ncbi:beta-defensin 134 [Trichosurus vulpecula]|uniref:beta-defensin 134 n=1 Tax=Trichosurus vulpecula TaxID=9337 RepID=UPI00186B473E|nr:beta-defensin 134 [Trichosurus vulpecula]
MVVATCDLNFLFWAKCEKNGTCRHECRTSEMLVAYCRKSMECCVLGHPEP